MTKLSQTQWKEIDAITRGNTDFIASKLPHRPRSSVKPRNTRILTKRNAEQKIHLTRSYCTSFHQSNPQYATPHMDATNRRSPVMRIRRRTKCDVHDWEYRHFSHSLVHAFLHGEAWMAQLNSTEVETKARQMAKKRRRWGENNSHLAKERNQWAHVKLPKQRLDNSALAYYTAHFSLDCQYCKHYSRVSVVIATTIGVHRMYS